MPCPKIDRGHESLVWAILPPKCIAGVAPPNATRHAPRSASAIIRCTIKSCSVYLPFVVRVWKIFL